MAVAISVLASALPWGPIMAFLVSSPLMSPSDFVFYGGLLGVRFALALTVASLVLGLGAGYLASFLEKTTQFFNGQIRLSIGTAARATTISTQPCHCSATEAPSEKSQQSCSSSVEPPQPLSLRPIRSDKFREFLREAADIGLKTILPYFSLFAAIGYFVNRLVPTEWIVSLFSGTRWYGVFLAGAIGLPLYVNGASAIPLLQVLMNAGASEGAVMAFLITGPATSVGVMAGVSMIMKRRALAFYGVVIFVGGILAGYAYDFVLRLIS